MGWGWVWGEVGLGYASPFGHGGEVVHCTEWLKTAHAGLRPAGHLLLLVKKKHEKYNIVSIGFRLKISKDGTNST